MRLDRPDLCGRRAGLAEPDPIEDMEFADQQKEKDLRYLLDELCGGRRMKTPIEKLIKLRNSAIREALVNLGRYKFDRFGYFAARYKVLNGLLHGTDHFMKNNPSKPWLTMPGS